MLIVPLGALAILVVLYVSWDRASGASEQARAAVAMVLGIVATS